MMPLKDLLNNAIKRARVSTQVTASQVVSCANEALSRVLAPERLKDARALSYKETVLTFEVKHAATGQFLSENEDRLLRFMKEHLPDISIRTVRYRIVHRFRTTEL